MLIEEEATSTFVSKRLQVTFKRCGEKLKYVSRSTYFKAGGQKAVKDVRPGSQTTL